jgi:ribose-phosphate pyrophosphokinase
MFAEYIEEKGLKDITVVSPDVGAVILSRHLAALLDNAPIAIIDKRRTEHNKAVVMNIIGEVKGRNAIIIDDIVDTGGTITAAAEIIKQKGAKDVKIFATHGLLSKNASERILNSVVSEAVFMDSIAIPPEKLNSKIKQLTMAKLLSKVIYRIHKGQSLGELFDWEEKVNGG